MSTQINQTGNYTFKKEEVLFSEGSILESLNILLKGKIDVYLSPYTESSDLHSETFNDAFRIFSIDQNVFIGTIDLFLKNEYSFTYKAAEDTYIYAYPIVDEETFSELLHSQKDYASHTITSISMMMLKSYEALENLESDMRKLAIFLDNLSLYFWLFKDKYNLTHMPISVYLNNVHAKYQELKSLGLIPSEYASPYLDQELIVDATLDYSYLDQTVKDKLEYYRHIINLPLPLRKSFFGADDYLANHHFNDAAKNFESIKYHIKEVIHICHKYFKRIYDNNEKCIYSEFMKLIEEAKKYGQNTDELFIIFNDLTNKIIKISDAFNEKYLNSFDVNKSQLLINSQLIKLDSKNQIKDNIDQVAPLIEIPEELIDSAEKIIRYSSIPNDDADLFRHCLNVFKGLDNKLTTDKETRDLINSILPIFFSIYENVFKKAFEENNQSPLINMFLNYGYMDEKLLSTEEVLTLYALTDQSNEKGYCSIYNMREWLNQIYLMEKNPSINEFDQDYFDVFREMKKRREVSDHDKAKYEQDVDGRLSYEIHNMFKTNHKLVYGQPNTYFPVLHSAMISRNLSKAFVTKDKVNETVKKILSIDFSAFHRELLYQNKKTGVEKEIISVAVAPDIILLPTFGFKSIMWQVITGRVRNTPGRFILPIFTGEDLEDMFIQLIGNFRWELCKTMMGMSWNDIKDKSLTSEYMDYIQFYKKNKDLSEEAKEKIRSQILRYNSKTREIFTSDYETWVKHESKGSIRHNKVVRNILFKYCPFEKSIRERFEKQPIFNELAVPYNAARIKQAKDLENRYHRLLDNDISKDEALCDNLKFYKEM